MDVRKGEKFSYSWPEVLPQLLRCSGRSPVTTAVNEYHKCISNTLMCVIPVVCVTN